MNVANRMDANSRLLLSALADRLVYGDEETFDPADARELARLLPRPSRWQRLAQLLPNFRAEGTLPGTSSAGYAAGVGNVSMRENASSFEIDTRGRRVVRAGQWKLCWSGRSIEIEQVAAGEMDEGRSAQIRFFRGEPVDMRLLNVGSLALGPLVLQSGTFRPWKRPQHAP